MYERELGQNGTCVGLNSTFDAVHDLQERLALDLGVTHSGPGIVEAAGRSGGS